MYLRGDDLSISTVISEDPHVKHILVYVPSYIPYFSLYIYRPSPHMLVLVTSERFLPTRVTFRVILARESHRLQPMLVLPVHWWPAPAGVGNVIEWERERWWYQLSKGHFTHETESPWLLHCKHSHWWKRWSWSKFASHYAWGTNGVRDCKMDVKSTWTPTWHPMDHVSWSLGLFSKTTSWR